MFGFLRRKKPAPTPAAPVETFAPLEALKPAAETPVVPPPEVTTAPPEAPEPPAIVPSGETISASAPSTAPVQAPTRPTETPRPVWLLPDPPAPALAPAPPLETGPAPAPAAPAGLPPREPAPAALPRTESPISPPATVAAPVARAPAPPPAGPATVASPPPAEPTLANSAWVQPSDLPPAPVDRPKAVEARADTGQVAGSEERKGWMSRLRKGLGKTRGNIVGLLRLTRIDEDLFEELETALLTSDTGFEATERLLAALRSRVKSQALSSGEQVRQCLSQLIAEALMPLEKPIDIDEALPLVMMITGVNGAGKTTSIGKLTHHLQREGKSILLAAGDTFRAAAREQLATWGSRNEVQVIAQQGGDPAAVAFDAVSAGVARGTGVVMIDTAGRLPTQTHLMDELKKIKRVLGKAMHGAPHQTLLILDGNTGQNMLAQVKAFDEAVGLTGLIITKLDGTAKGGALLGLAWQQRDRPIPVYFIGVGEGIDDLQAFSAVEFADALTGQSES